MLCVRGYQWYRWRPNWNWRHDHSPYAEWRLLLLSDGLTSGGLLVAGEIPKASVIGARAGKAITIGH